MKSDSIREWLVERVALGEAPPDTVLTEAEQARLSALPAENKAILEKYPAQGVHREVTRRRRQEEKRGARRTFQVILAPSLAAAMAAAFVVGTDLSKTVPGEETRLKGADLLIHRKTENGAELLTAGQRVQAGDRLQISFRLDAPKHAVLLSIDGGGVVSLHLPRSGEPAAPYVDAGTTSLPYSYELDDAPGFEHFVLVTSKFPFGVQALVSVAQRYAETTRLSQSPNRSPLELGNDFSQLDLILLKEKI